MTSYETDVHAWALEQARLLRERRYEELDIEHLADEIADVARAEERELARRLSELLASLLAWQEIPSRRGAVARTAIRYQRREIAQMIAESPSLRDGMRGRWLGVAWGDAVATLAQDADVEHLPRLCPWAVREQVLAEGWVPGAEEADAALQRVMRMGRGGSSEGEGSNSRGR